jgi:peptidoglycan hydrolase CwlO-like protein
MPEALHPAEDAAQEVSFELDTFTLAGADRLELTGRWFGVRGRRFVRPMLTLLVGGESHRSLADLEHKPWAAEDGQPWTAAFPLEFDIAELGAVELAVGSDLTLALPLPPGAGGSPRTRRPSRRKPKTAAAGPPEAKARMQALVAERDALKREVEQIRTEHEKLESALGRLSEEREQWQAQHSELSAERNRSEAVLDRLRAERDRFRAALDRVQTDREQLRTDRDQLRTERDELRAQRDRLWGEHERLRTERGELHDQRDRLRGERDQLVSAAHDARVSEQRQRAPAAHAPRPATAPAHAPRPAARTRSTRANWAGRALALVVLVGVIVALVILVRG